MFMFTLYCKIKDPFDKEALIKEGDKINFIDNNLPFYLLLVAPNKGFSWNIIIYKFSLF